MPGKILFKEGRHPTRQVSDFKIEYSPSKNLELYKTLCKALGEKLIYSDYLYLLFEIHSAEHEEKKRINNNMTRKNSLAQLKALTRIKDDDDLVRSVQNTDINTFLMISEAQTDLITEKLFSTGYFIDSEGEHCTYTPTLDQYTHPGIKYYLPDGISGLRDAISLALKICDSNKEGRGRKKIKSRCPLAKAVWRIWKKYRPEASQEIWQRDGECSPALFFAQTIFETTYRYICLYSLAEIMKESLEYKKRSKKPM